MAHFDTFSNELNVKFAFTLLAHKDLLTTFDNFKIQSKFKLGYRWDQERFDSEVGHFKTCNKKHVEKFIEEVFRMEGSTEEKYLNT
jgi:hypothetical protein